MSVLLDSGVLALCNGIRKVVGLSGVRYLSGEIENVDDPHKCYIASTIRGTTNREVLVSYDNVWVNGQRFRCPLDVQKWQRQTYRRLVFQGRIEE